MNSKKNLFICSSQYQLINGINLINANYSKSENDLLVMNYGNDILNKIDMHCLKQLFRKIYLVEICGFTDCKIKKYISLLKNLFSRKPLGIDLRNKYDHIFITGTEMYSKIVAMKYWKKGTKIYFIEDGLGSYNAILSKDYKSKQDMPLKLVYGKKSLDICEGIYVYQPEILINNSYKIPVFRININLTCNYQDMLLKLFQNNLKPFSKQIVFLNAWFKDDEKYLEQEIYLKVLASKYSEKYCVKLHPNEVNDDISNNYCIEDCGNFEIANGLFDISNKVYISIISTACLTPSIIYGKRPYIIFLYKIFMKKFDMPDWYDVEKVIERFIIIKEYENRIFIPNSLEEYKKILDMLNIYLSEVA